jgi:hypothetical protein
MVVKSCKGEEATLRQHVITGHRTPDGGPRSLKLEAGVMLNDNSWFSEVGGLARATVGYHPHLSSIPHRRRASIGLPAISGYSDTRAFVTEKRPYARQYFLYTDLLFTCRPNCRVYKPCSYEAGTLPVCN